MGHFRAGFHISLLAGMGIFSAPVLGVLSDKFGRKAVLLPGLASSAVGLIFGINGLIGAASPFLVTLIINHAGGLSSIFYYSGILTAISAVVVVFIPLRPSREVKPNSG